MIYDGLPYKEHNNMKLSYNIVCGFRPALWAFSIGAGDWRRRPRRSRFVEVSYGRSKRAAVRSFPFSFSLPSSRLLPPSPPAPPHFPSSFPPFCTFGFLSRIFPSLAVLIALTARCHVFPFLRLISLPSFLGSP